MIEHVWRVACDGLGCGAFGPTGDLSPTAIRAAVAAGYERIRRVAPDGKVTFRWRCPTCRANNHEVG